MTEINLISSFSLYHHSFSLCLPAALRKKLSSNEHDFAHNFFSLVCANCQNKIDPRSRLASEVILSIPYGLSAKGTGLKDKSTSGFCDLHLAIVRKSPDANGSGISCGYWVGINEYAICCLCSFSGISPE